MIFYPYKTIQKNVNLKLFVTKKRVLKTKNPHPLSRMGAIKLSAA